MNFFSPKLRERLYCIAVKISPFLTGAIIAPPENRFSAPAYVFAYFSFLVPITLWLFSLRIIAGIKKEEKELKKRIKTVLSAGLGILALGYAHYRFSNIENWFEAYLLFMGSAAFAILKVNRLGVFVSASTIALLSIATVRGRIEVIPVIISLFLGFGALALSLAKLPEPTKRWFKPVFALSISVPTVIVAFLAFQRILPPQLALLLFIIPFVTKPNETLKKGEFESLAKDTAAAFLLFLISCILFGMV